MVQRGLAHCRGGRSKGTTGACSIRCAEHTICVYQETRHWWVFQDLSLSPSWLSVALLLGGRRILVAKKMLNCCILKRGLLGQKNMGREHSCFHHWKKQHELCQCVHLANISSGFYILCKKLCTSTRNHVGHWLRIKAVSELSNSSLVIPIEITALSVSWFSETNQHVYFLPA